MGRTPDRFPGTLEEDELKLLPESSDPTTVGAVRLVSGAFRFRDNGGVFDPRTVGGAAGLRLLVLTLAGGVVYDNFGEIVLKQSA